MKAWLAGFGVTHEAVLDAIDAAMSYLYGDRMIFSSGLCGIFRYAKANIAVCSMLRALGGSSREGFFWAQPDPRNKRAAEQRLMMLAFLLEWTK